MTFQHPEFFIVDLMVENGRAHILEIGDMTTSGFSGFEYAYDCDYNDLSESFIQQHQIEAFNRSLVLDGCYNFKTWTAQFVSPLNPEIFPQQQTYIHDPTQSGEAVRHQILKDFKNSDYVVFKVPHAFKAKGVFIVSLDDLRSGTNEEIEKRFFGTGKNAAVFNGAANPLHGIFVVQRAVNADPVVFQDPRPDLHTEAAPYQTGLWFKPTIRLAICARPSTNGAPQFDCLAAYYKLPENGYVCEQDAVHPELNNRSTIISDIGEDEYSNAMRIPDNVKQDIFDQITRGLSPAFESLHQSDDEKFLHNLLRSDDLIDCVSALHMLTTARGQGFMQWYLERLSPDDQFEIFMNIRGKAQNNSGMRSLIEYVGCRNNAFHRFFKTERAPGKAAMITQYGTGTSPAQMWVHQEKF